MVVAAAVAAILLWAPSKVLAWCGGVVAAAAVAYLSHDFPHQVVAVLKGRKAQREVATSTPLTFTAQIQDQDYVVLSDGDQILDVPASGHTVRLVVTGAGPSPVVLTGLRAEVICREERFGDLARHAAEIPLRRFEVLLDFQPPIVRALTSSDFPYQVKRDDSEVFDLMVRTESGDVRWVLWLDWSSGGRSGSTRIDLNGQEFRTAARHSRTAARWLRLVRCGT
jgi:hypothetical protein